MSAIRLSNSLSRRRRRRIRRALARLTAIAISRTRSIATTIATTMTDRTDPTKSPTGTVRTRIWSRVTRGGPVSPRRRQPRPTDSTSVTRPTRTRTSTRTSRSRQLTFLVTRGRCRGPHSARSPPPSFRALSHPSLRALSPTRRLRRTRRRCNNYLRSIVDLLSLRCPRRFGETRIRPRTSQRLRYRLRRLEPLLHLRHLPSRRHLLPLVALSFHPLSPLLDPPSNPGRDAAKNQAILTTSPP